MTSILAAAAAVRSAVIIALAVLVFIQGLLFFSELKDKHSLKAVLSGIWTGVSIYALIMTAAGASAVTLAGGALKIAGFIYELPWLAIAVYAVVSILLAFIWTWRLLSYRRDDTEVKTVVEAIDKLPVGICCTDPRGFVIIENTMMKELTDAAFGDSLMSPEERWQAASSGHIPQGKVERTPAETETVTDPAGEIRIEEIPKLTLSLDGHTHEVSRREVAAKDGALIIYTSEDVSERFELEGELDDVFDKLKESQKHIQELDLDTKEAEAAASRLAGRKQAYDDLASCVTASRYYLNTLAESDEGPDGLAGTFGIPTEPGSLIDMWRQESKELKG